MFGAPAASALPAAASVRHAAIDIFKAVEGFFLIIIIIIAVLAGALSFVKDYFNLFEGQNRPSLLDSAVETTRLRRAPFPLGDKHVEAIDGAQRTRQHHGMKVRDAIKLIESDGWYLARTRGSHRQFK
jgi:hypothetical protein